VDSTNRKSIGHNASQPAKIQVRNTIATTSILGSHISKWSGSARKELTLGGDVSVSNKNGNHIDTAPKLALVILSTTFRKHFETAPDSDELKVSHVAVGERAVRVLLEWTKSIVRSSNGKYDVGIPDSTIELLRLRFAANKLSM
jgi:phage tail tape-measure protein